MRTLAPALLALLAAAIPIPISGAETIRDSLDWQRIDLETRLGEKIERALVAILPEGSFFIDVSIRLRPEGRGGAKRAAPAGRTAESATRVPLGKLNVDVVPPAPKAEEAPRPGIFSSIQAATVSIFIDTSVPENRKDLITQVVESITDPVIGEGNADLRIERIALRAKASNAAWDRSRWIEETKAPFVAFLVTLMLCATAGMIFVSHRKLELR
jgi:hypothetical protein